jgi:hypothetical protein
VKPLPRGLLGTLAAVVLFTIALAVLCTRPASTLGPVRATVLELDEPTPGHR